MSKNAIGNEWAITFQLRTTKVLTSQLNINEF